jgi:hypothetical protein
MHQIGIVCHSARSPSPSLLEGSVWIGTPGPALGEVSPILLKNHPSALAESGFVTSAIADGVAARTMRVCARSALVCILPLGVAFTSVGRDPTKRVVTTSALQTFVALGTLVDLVAHTYAVPPATLTRIHTGLTALVTGPPGSVSVTSPASRD